MRKFEHEIHANEISILPYYIACLNIEQAFYEATQSWKEFGGACFVNTLENWGFAQKHQGGIDDIFGSLTDENHERILAQNARKIPVIMGNPPYNANQKNENDNNKNQVALRTDQRIKDTYLAASIAQKTKLYDPYIRFFRWASDRIGDEGIIGFVTNRSYLDSRQADGFRKVIAQEFQEVWIVDLMSDVRKNPKISGTKHNIFGIQTGVAIVFLVRNPQRDGCDIRYLALDDAMTAVDKRRWLMSHHLRQLFKAGEFALISPSPRGEWIKQSKNDWPHSLAVASKEAKAGKTDEAIFRLHSLGVVTNRDEWVYGKTTSEVTKKMRYLIKYYESARKGGVVETGDIKWTRSVKADFAKGVPYQFSAKSIIESLRRPFVHRRLYYHHRLNEMQYRLPSIFGKDGQLKNVALCVTNMTSTQPFSTLVTHQIPDLHLLGDTAVFPYQVYAKDGTLHDNITDWALKQFQARYPDAAMDKPAIFDYVYAVLHHPAYREKYALNLKSEFPHIPFYADFQQWAAWGKQLIALHTHYADLTAYPLTRTDCTLDRPAAKSKLKAYPAEGRIEIDVKDKNTLLTGIPPEAWTYRLGNRSAIEWVLEEYRDYTPKDPTIKEKFHTYRFADHKETVIALIGKVCQVSVETAAITAQMQKTGEI
jgi:predicted helicase